MVYIFLPCDIIRARFFEYIAYMKGRNMFPFGATFRRNQALLMMGGVQGSDSLDMRSRQVLGFDPSGQLTDERLRQIELQLGEVAEAYTAARSNELLMSQEFGTPALDVQNEASVELAKVEEALLGKLHLAEELVRRYLPEQAEELVRQYQRIAWSIPNIS